MARKLKENRLRMAVDLSLGEEHPNNTIMDIKVPRSIRLKSGDIVLEKSISSLRNMGRYKNKRVFIEWKSFEKRFEDKLKPRIEAFAILLSRATDTSIGSLPFLGFFQDHGSDRYAFVFETQANPVLENDSEPDNVLTLCDHFSATKPPFDVRLAIARSLAQAVRQLHTAGWLHKGIRSENLVFFYSNELREESIQGPYLADFSYARMARLTEFSEPAFGTRELLTQLLYTHKASLQGSSFRKCFDVFSMGLVLLEIGLWKDLRTILASTSEQFTQMMYDPPQDMAPIVSDLRDGLLSAVGSDSIQAQLREGCPIFYSWAVTRCLDLASTTLIDDLESSIQLQTAIVEDLERSQ